MKFCPACYSSETAVFFETPQDYEYFTVRVNEAQILKCATCGSIYQTPWPSEEETASFYPPDYQNYTRKDIPLLSNILKIFINSSAQKFIREFGIVNKLLDFGCGDGTFLESLSDMGMLDIVGFEPHERENAVIYEAGFSIIGCIDELRERGPFDLIRMNHVIEHLSALDETMRFLANLLTPTGRIIIQTPNPQSLTFILFKKFWGPLHYPYHTILFTHHGLEESASRWGMAIESVGGTIFPTGWSMSLENIIKTMAGTKHRGRLPFYGLLVPVTTPIAILEKAIFNYSTAVVDYVLVKKS